MVDEGEEPRENESEEGRRAEVLSFEYRQKAESANADDLLDDLDDDAFLEAWDAVDRECVELLRSALAVLRGTPPPIQVAGACERLRAGFASDSWPYDWVRRAAGFGRHPRGDDPKLLIDAVAATISPRAETGLAAEEESLIITLEHADWLGAVLGLVRSGEGTPARASAIVSMIEACPEVSGDVDPDGMYLVEAAFEIIVPAWQAAGSIDDRHRLTALGVWTLPRALAQAWGGDFDAELG